MEHELLPQANWTVVHVSDLHLEPSGTEQYPGLYERVLKIGSVVRDINPDLVVATGDLTNRGSSTPEHFAMARAWLDSLQAPYLAMPGNHDLGANPLRGRQFPMLERYEESQFHATGYASVFGPDPVSRVTVGDLAVIGISLREDDPDGVVESLARTLAETPGPVVVAGHYPLVATRVLTSRQPFGALGYVTHAAERLHELLLSHEKVIAYLCGHVHLTSMRMIGTHCAQFTAGGAGPGAAALRIYKWNGRSLHYSTLDLEGPKTFWERELPEARSNPEFSSGSREERAGVWEPPWAASQQPSWEKQSSLGRPS